MAVKTINRGELSELMFRGEKIKIVDVLPTEHYKEEHIKGAISLPLDDIETKAKDLLKKNEKIIVYCASFDCLASTKAAEKLMKLGFKNVLDYKGGLKDYEEGYLPLEGSNARESSGCRTCG